MIYSYTRNSEIPYKYNSKKTYCYTCKAIRDWHYYGNDTQLSCVTCNYYWWYNENTSQEVTQWKDNNGCNLI